MAAVAKTGGPWGALNRFIGALQRIVGRVLFLLILVIIVMAIIDALTPEPGPSVPENGVVAWTPVGVVVEEAPQVSAEDAINNAVLGGGPTRTILLENTLRTLDAIAEDEEVTTLVLNLNAFGGGTASALHEIADSLRTIRESGKEILVHSEFYNDADYLLAAQGSEIWLHPFGQVEIDGYSRFGTYYASLVEKLRVTVNVFRVGTFKSAVEPFLLDAMSEEAKEANRGWLGVLWTNYKDAVEEGRDLPAGTIQTYADEYAARVILANGDVARTAVDAGLVDVLIGRGALRDRLVERFGEDEDNEGQFERIGFGQYASLIEDEPQSDNVIAVVRAVGGITGGSGDGGVVGGDQHAKLIRQAREDENVKAIVIRVDSGGGGVFPSELIREELENAKDDGKIIIASMGGVAASGGYWISTPAEEIWASPTTITGSIGIFGLIPTFERVAEWAGVTEDGVGTTRAANAVSELSGISEEVRPALQAGIEEGYRRFLTVVAESRNMTLDEVDQIAQGRVWAGETALELGLVDQLGGLSDAIASAASKAGLEEGDYSVKHFIETKTRLESLLDELGIEAQNAVVEAAPTPARGLVQSILRDVAFLDSLDDPTNRYLTCLECEAADVLQEAD